MALALASSDNNKHIYVKEPKNVNKDSPKLPNHDNHISCNKNPAPQGPPPINTPLLTIRTQPLRVPPLLNTPLLTTRTQPLRVPLPLIPHSSQ